MKILKDLYNQLPEHLQALFTVQNIGKSEVTNGFPTTPPAKANQRGAGINGRTFKAPEYESTKRGHDDDGGSAARFFYQAKASKRDRDEGLDGFDEVRAGGMQTTLDGSILTGSGNEHTTTRANNHPTAKNSQLMRYLCKLITPPNGVVLDPFTGSGSTGKAALREGFQFIGIEMEEEYVTIARARLEHELRNKS